MGPGERAELAGGYGPPGGGMPPGGGGYGGPPAGPPPGGGGGGYGGPPPGGGGYGGPPPGGGGYGGGPPPGGGYGPPGGYPPQGFGPPGGGFPPPGGPMMPGSGADVNTTLPLVLGIVSMVVCGNCLLGIPAIILAVMAMNAKNVGNLEDARSKAKTSTILSIVGFGLVAVGLVIYVLIFGLAMMSGNVH